MESQLEAICSRWAEETQLWWDNDHGYWLEQKDLYRWTNLISSSYDARKLPWPSQVGKFKTCQLALLHAASSFHPDSCEEDFKAYAVSSALLLAIEAVELALNIEPSDLQSSET